MLILLGEVGADPCLRCVLEGVGRSRGRIKKASTVAPTPRHKGRQSSKLTIVAGNSTKDGSSSTSTKPKSIVGGTARISVVKRSVQPSCWNAPFILPTSSMMPSTAQSSRANATEIKKSDGREAGARLSSKGEKRVKTPFRGFCTLDGQYVHLTVIPLEVGSDSQCKAAAMSTAKSSLPL